MKWGKLISFCCFIVRWKVVFEVGGIVAFIICVFLFLSSCKSYGYTLFGCFSKSVF